MDLVEKDMALFNNLSKKFNDIFSGVGIHPMNISEDLNEESFLHIHSLALNNEKVLVMSEIGLDFTENISTRKIQYDIFRQQIRIALDFLAFNLPQVL